MSAIPATTMDGPTGVRIHKIPGHPHHIGYVPTAALLDADHTTNTMTLIPDIM